MNIIKINQILSENNFPKYRLSQVLDGIFKQFAGSWSEITNLPKELIEILEKEAPLSSLEAAQDFEALPKDAAKILFKSTRDETLKVQIASFNEQLKLLS